MYLNKLNILFLVHTEYHMMVTLSLIADKYYDPQKYNVFIYQTENLNKTRFQFSKNISILKNVYYKTLIYDDKCKIYNEELGYFIKDCLSKKIDILVIFNHHAFLPVYLTKLLYKNGSQVYLAPDGLKPYSNSKKITPRWSILTALNYYKFLRVNRLPYIWNFPRLTYASLKEIEKVLVQFPEKYRNISNKQIEKVEILTSSESIKLIYKYFKFNIKDELDTFEKIIFYINQPFKDKSIYDYEIKFLKKLQLKFREYKLIIKLHPLTELNQKDRFKKLDNVDIIYKSTPAELYIANIRNSIILSFWSTACLIVNNYNRIYWAYPILKKNNIMLNFLELENPTKHIILVKKIEEIK